MKNISNITTIYVSQKNGQWYHSGLYKEEIGDMQGPVDSIENALKLVGDLRRAGAGQPITIAITDEVYNVENPVRITNEVNSVTIKGLNNTLISGGRRITGFKEDTFNGVKCFSAEVSGIDDGFWFTDLYVDGLRADFTYLPKEGFFEPKSVENNNKEVGTPSKWFIAKKEDAKLFKTFRNFSDCFISYNHYWIDEHSPVESIDTETGKIVMEYSSRFSISDTNERSKLRYKLENVAEAFENKNEWYLDRETKKVYYIPRDEKQTPESIMVYAPVAEKLFRIEGTEEKNVEYIAFSKLTFANTRGDYHSPMVVTEDREGEDIVSEESAICGSDPQAVCWAHADVEFTYARGCSIENCVFKNLGVHAVNINRGCSNMRVYRNKFYDLGAGALKINGGSSGCRKGNETFDVTVSQNVIECIGRRYHAACGILMRNTHSNTISHNDISDTFYTGISAGWVWGYGESITRDILIEKNHIHNIGQGLLSDMGGIYLLGTQPGTVIRNNIIHNVKSKHYGGHGIYTDEGTCYVLIENNICYDNNSTGFNQHYGRMNTVRNNIFAKAGQEPVRSSKEEMHTSFILERNIVVSDGTPSYRAGYGSMETGHLHKISGSDNLHFNTSGDVNIFAIGDRKFSLSEIQQRFGGEDGSIIADPKFMDYENNDFTLCEDSPALELGFEPIDTSDVGVTVKIRSI